jgi:4-hydroxy-4-methyl-2-oxoglutarate aldolase
MNSVRLTLAQLNQLRQFSTTVVASAIEALELRLRNVGFTNSTIRCQFPDLPPVVGYAVTARIRSSDPPIEGKSYYHRPDWWECIQTIPEPRVVVIEDTDHPPGLGAFVGEVHANILSALKCVALVTNGAVRDMREVRAIGFQMFAGNVSVSHAYAHIFDFGGAITVGGLKVGPGDLLHADLNGVLNVPSEIAAGLPHLAAEIVDKRRRLVEVCRSKEFNPADLLKAVEEMTSTRKDDGSANPQVKS